MTKLGKMQNILVLARTLVCQIENSMPWAFKYKHCQKDRETILFLLNSTQKQGSDKCFQVFIENQLEMTQILMYVFVEKRLNSAELYIICTSICFQRRNKSSKVKKLCILKISGSCKVHFISRQKRRIIFCTSNYFFGKKNLLKSEGKIKMSLDNAF